MADGRNAAAYDALGNDGGGVGGGMEGDERERGMVTVLLPMRNLLGSIHSYLETNPDAKVFTGLYHLAVGMEVGRAMSTSTRATTMNATTLLATKTKEEEMASLLAKEKAVECDDEDQDR